MGLDWSGNLGRDLPRDRSHEWARCLLDLVGEGVRLARITRKKLANAGVLYQQK